MAVEKTNLWVDVFQRDLEEGFDASQMYDKVKPGLLSFRGWGLERQLSADRRRYIDDLRADIEALRKAMPPAFPYVHGVAEAEQPVNLKVSVRGSPYKLGDEVPRRFLSILSEGDPLPFVNGSGRLELANAIGRQPIAMRVIVNRIWKQHFGTGIVDSPSNFGFTGERPTNPDLLDYLAASFMENGLSVKKLHRAIMLSSVYQLSDAYSAAAFEKDSGNRFYWRANRHRMGAEQIRDAVLAVSGSLEFKMGGPSEPLTPHYSRRTVYGKVSRFKLDTYLQLFDFPSPNLSSEKRFTTNVPLQRLFFMNSDFMQQQAEVLARRVADLPDDTARIHKAYQLVLGREPSDAEVRAGLDYLAAEPMKEYEERKAALAKEPAAPKAKAKPKPEDRRDDDGQGMTGEGMMAGVLPGAEDKAEEKRLLPVTTWGRYVKILLSSNEFLFVN
jgi:hypothetical protein